MSTALPQVPGDLWPGRLEQRWPRVAAYARAFLRTDRRLARFWSSDDGAWTFVTLSAPNGAAEVHVLIEHREPPFDLTRRELEVLTLVAGGLSNAQIAARLVMSRHTVTTHVEHILAKLALPTRAAAAALAVEHGLLVLPAPGGGAGLRALTVGLIEAYAAEERMAMASISMTMCS